ncbi:hypothetical protein D3C87_2001990 [compost metagenome]
MSFKNLEIGKLQRRQLKALTGFFDKQNAATIRGGRDFMAVELDDFSLCFHGFLFGIKPLRVKYTGPKSRAGLEFSEEAF